MSVLERFEKIKSQYEYNELKLKELKENKTQAIQEAADIEQAQILFQKTAAAIQKEVHQKISTLVTRCMKAVFEEDFEFKINFEQKRGKTEAELIIKKEGNEEDPLFGSGGELDVASFALRLSALLLQQPPLRRILILDEPFRCVDAKKRPRLRKLLESLSSELGIQIVIITHDPNFQIGKVITIGESNDEGENNEDSEGN